MIELPRAALTAFRIAEVAEFFSFGTNDLTQTAWGFSRDDVEAAFFAAYLEKGVFTVSPFETLDQDGVGRLVRIAAEEGRATRPDLKLGVCGEHGGDPESVHFFHDDRAGLRLLLAVPGPGRPPGGRPCRSRLRKRHPLTPSADCRHELAPPVGCSGAGSGRRRRAAQGRAARPPRRLGVAADRGARWPRGTRAPRRCPPTPTCSRTTSPSPTSPTSSRCTCPSST